MIAVLGRELDTERYTEVRTIMQVMFTVMMISYSLTYTTAWFMMFINMVGR